MHHHSHLLLLSGALDDNTHLSRAALHVDNVTVVLNKQS
jgi:hypothetical protein